ncbi:hemerythrin domain-containing protein [Neobacillus terrae]|uniref:hemerythrin domain-containing protein n=1 Tax=Neobacillus terrae TaxID=3034837 RepID=UPI001408EBF0|nr:hemerythrin domain-containing protein [Neobacillus terrae]NHM29577.1 hemerythrin domain-containing protein [Neobacillus terrae]
MNGCTNAFGGMPTGELSVGLKQLKSEHPSLLDKLEVQFNLVQQIEKDLNRENNFIELIRRVSEFMAELEPHSKREEGVLFPMMGAYIGTTSGPIAVMEYEHDQAKGYIGSFLKTALEDRVLSIDEIKEQAQLIKSAYFTLTEHFAKEENVLFPMAERMLSDEEKEELARKIKEIK